MVYPPFCMETYVYRSGRLVVDNFATTYKASDSEFFVGGINNSSEMAGVYVPGKEILISSVFGEVFDLGMAHMPSTERMLASHRYSRDGTINYDIIYSWGVGGMYPPGTVFTPTQDILIQSPAYGGAPQLRSVYTACCDTFPEGEVDRSVMAMACMDFVPYDKGPVMTTLWVLLKLGERCRKHFFWF